MGILRSDRVSGLGGANAIVGSTKFVGNNAESGASKTVTYFKDPSLAPGTSDFCAEGWFYFNFVDTVNNQYLFQNLTGNFGAANSTGWAVLRIGANNQWYGWSGSGWVSFGAGAPTRNTWHYMQLVRASNVFTLYKDGTALASTVSNSNDLTNDELCIAARDDGAESIDGFVSNFRLTIGSSAAALAGIVPTAASRVLSTDTKILCCNDPGNVNNEDAQGLPTRTTPDNDVKLVSQGFASRFVPDVGEDYGTTFADNTKFDTLSYMVPPGGTTTQRGRGTALFAGGYVSPNATADIEYLSIPSGGITTKWGNLSTTQLSSGQSLSSKTRQLIGGGWASPLNNDKIEYVEIATSGNSITFGDLVVGRRGSSSVSNDTRGIFGGGYISPADAGTPTMDYVTIATTANAQDFGDLSGNAKGGTATGSTTRAVFALGNVAPSDVNTLEYVTIATLSDYTNFGDLPSGSFGRYNGSCSSNTRGIFAGGHYPTSVNIINYITIASLGDAEEFGDLFLARGFPSGVSNGIRGVFMGGTTNPARQDTIDSIIIATKGDAVNWGDMRVATQAQNGASSDSHGGLT